MIIVFGGAYQGKTDFAKAEFGLADSDIFECTEDGSLDLEKKAVSHLERFILKRIRDGKEVFGYFEEIADKLKDKIIICDDICCGVVPIEKEQRLWRDNVGKQMQIFCRGADEVYRVYCSLGERLK
ncbi:MAG: bifunctional adenosylcobinamide kinase/adenosylcobinamide-phosphate guanylyltransferase [Eubacteriales bacterium]|nr:bifunctional adenosylcobinamide kinase/adenosylcobinamide-phosphate guanylyltransferase [Eubacteriales bacterium]